MTRSASLRSLKTTASSPARRLRGAASALLVGAHLMVGTACLPARAVNGVPVLQNVNWPEYLGGPDRNHASPLSQINRGNVRALAVAWTFRSGDFGQMQTNPLVIDGTLYSVTGTATLFALDAATGAEKWHLAPPKPKALRTLRGVSYWTDGKLRRILYCVDDSLCSVDADTGQLDREFGEGGRVSLRAGLGAAAEKMFITSTTPGTVFEDLIIMPTRVGETEGAAPGHIQAFHIPTGRLAWVFRTIPATGEFGHDTWPADAQAKGRAGGANCWAGMAVDRARGLVFVPTGSATPDFWGGDREGQGLFANCLLALDARTGKRQWHHQIVHHDLWDRDLPAPPNLVTLRRDGRTIDAVAQITKSGHVFVFERETGVPVFPIDEVPVPASSVPGEKAWPTQPVPRTPRPFARQELTVDDLNPYSKNRDEIREEFKRLRTGAFVPFSLDQGTLLFPGFDGGGEWGGAAVDESGIMYVNASEMAWIGRLGKAPSAEQLSSASPGEQVYLNACAACHGIDRGGNPTSGFPELREIAARRTRAEVDEVITRGRGMMPGFGGLASAQKAALISFLMGDEKIEAGALPGRAGSLADGGVTVARSPVRFGGYQKFLDVDGYPAIRPPWGTLTAIDLNGGEHRWRITLGEFPELTERGIPPTGTENYGGPLVTSGGLVFIAATKDGKFRAFSARDGEKLWETTLPAAAFATPATYAVNGRQYVVIACGGGKIGVEKGDAYVAFALPPGH